MNSKIQYAACLFIAAFLGVSAGNCFASADPPVIKVLNGGRGQLHADSSVTVEDNYFDTSYRNKIDTPLYAKNIITFRINEDTGIYLPSAFTASVSIRITFTFPDLSVDSVDTVLAITYKPAHDSIYKTRNYVFFSGAHRVKVKILSVSAGSPAISALLLENEIQAFPDYKFSCTGSAIRDVDLRDPSNGNTDERRADWPNVIGADEYDVEWAYIDSAAVNNYKDGSGHYIPAKIFDNNASRVTTTDIKFRIPLIFPDPGILFARARPAQLKPDGTRITANWSSDYLPDGMANYSFSGHQPGLNWQAATSFAEDGKDKVVIQYFDGSLRSRQTVTKDNTVNATVVAETFYDAQGRPVIQVLPAPTLNNIIGFTKNFNRYLSSAEYDKGLYDTLYNDSDYCCIAAPIMDSTGGASQYYSSYNPDTTKQNRFIPAARGYAFTETRYTQDNTGRISSQSGVGPAFKIGGGHETKYYYGTADQKELDALFGTEAGDYTHYFKNMVRDANGQYSVSYVDMHGRTIATALAGDHPAGMDTLASFRTDTISETLSTPQSNIISGLMMESKKSLLVARADTFYFNYNLDSSLLTRQDCSSNPVCYDCLYDLEIIITDDCNNKNFGGKPFDTTRRNFTLNAIDTACSHAPAGFHLNFKKYLQPGNYEISKKLSVSRYALDYYRDSVFMVKNTCYTLQHFINVQVHDQCAPDCLDCYESLGTIDSFRNHFMESSGLTVADTTGYRDEIWAAYQSALGACKALCDSAAGDNDLLKQALLRDVSPPSGQYANLDNIDGYSVFSTSLGTSPYQRDTITYLDENGHTDYVTDDRTGLPVLPQALDQQQFALKFKSSWAEALLPFHPEYCKYIEYEKHISSYHWDEGFLKVDTWADADDLGYLDPPSSGHRDSLAIESGSYNTYLSGRISHYTQVTLTVGGSPYDVSLETLACLAIHCNSDNSCISDFVTHAKGFGDLACDGDRDMAWRMFRNLYLQVKRDLTDSLLRNAGCPAGHSNIMAGELIAAGHFPNFNSADSALGATAFDYALTAGPDDLVDSVKTALAAQYDENCRNYVKLWWQQLAPCGYNSTDSAAIIPKLIGVCKKGADPGHPYGSRQISPDSSYAYPDFDSVITEYNHLHSISLKTCNADLVSVPKPYNAQLIYSNKPVWTKPAGCDCSRINELYQEWLTNATAADTTFSAYLQRQYHTTISGDDLEQLISLCDSTGSTCSYLTAPISLPPALQCSSGDVCITCNQFNVLYQEFESTYDTVPVFTYPGDTTYQKINGLFANFMNNHFGFSKQPWEYLAFMQRCNNAGAPKCVSCDSLQKLIGKYFLSIIDSSAGNEDDMLNYIQDKLSDSAMTVTIYQIKQALTSCNNSWRQNIAFGSRGGRPFLFDKQANLNIGLHGNNFTIECRAYFANIQAHQPLLYNMSFKNAGYLKNNLDTNAGCGDHYKGYYIYMDTFNSKKYLFCRFADSVSYILLRTADTILPVHWYHIAITRTGDSIADFKIFLNGRQTNNILVSGSNKLVNGNITPATRGLLLLHNSYNGFGGDYACLKNLRLYKRALPFSEIEHNICDTLPYSTDSLKLWVKFIEGEGDPLDYSIYHNPGRWLRIEQNCALNANIPPPTENQKAIAWNCLAGPAVSDSCLPHYAFALCNYPTADSLLLCGKSDPVFPDTLQQVDNCSDTTFFAATTASALYRYYTDSLKGGFDSAYISKCLQAYQLESFTVTHRVSEYHYTLYYYDQAGNLLKTVPPQGVQAIRRQTWLDSVKTYRAGGLALVPAHTLITQYRYNTLNQVVAQQTPDAGKSTFYYDRLGRLALSQNAKQEPGDKFSYTLYDLLGRIDEVGELENSSDMTTDISKDASDLADWLADAAASRTQITRTTYDTGYQPLDTLMRAKNLRNRIAWTALYDAAADIATLSHAAATFFSYDIHGNVDTLVQDFKKGSMQVYQNRFKKIVYRYDLISGKVNSIAYQPRQADAFYHRYTYDAENRLTDAETSADSITWEHDAFYKYYRHGPLSRAIAGDRQVQGIDYAYTLQGWLKGVNATLCRNGNDMGGDGSASSVVARDAFGFVLYYYGDSDYKAVTTTKNVFAPVLTSGFKPLYNGNIAAMGVNIDTFPEPYLYMYTYDQLNRLTAMKAASKKITISTNLWTAATLNNYKENVSYDANGNILKYQRYSDAIPMDSLTYNYYSATNRLNYIKDTVADIRHTTDLDNQGSGNYKYDDIGNLTKDVKENIDTIYWNVYGKITQINKHNSDTIRYTYDASGNRISEIVSKYSSGTKRETWYVRDAGGNVMSVYTKGDAGINSGALSQTEIYLYGSSRLGVMKPNINVQSIAPLTKIYLHALGWGTFGNFTRGTKFFELSNHLGNVLVTVSDKKKALSDNGTTISKYDADVVSAQDYYPFGMLEPGRNISAANYRYGFNGKEQDNDVKGTANQIDYGARIYDSRVGRFLSVDPIANSFPWNSPYSYAENDPINFVDLDGAEKASPATVDMAKQLLNIIGNNITATKTKLSTATDESLKQNLQVSLELDKRTYAAIMVFIYRNNPTTTERVFDILNRAEPYVKEGLDITPAGDIKVVFTGKNFKGEEQNRYGAAGWLAFDIFGGEILSGLGKASRSLKLLKGAGADALEGVVKRVSNISTALDDVHLKAAVGDIFGNPIVINGKVYDHLTEVKNAINGLTKEIKKLNKIINNGKNAEDVINAAKNLRNTLSKQKNEINAILDRATKSAANK